MKAMEKCDGKINRSDVPLFIKHDDDTLASIAFVTLIVQVYQLARTLSIAAYTGRACSSVTSRRNASHWNEVFSMNEHGKRRRRKIRINHGVLRVESRGCVVFVVQKELRSIDVIDLECCYQLKARHVSVDWCCR
jgi:hypothetical protein